jgi:hypothetical protein
MKRTLCLGGPGNRHVPWSRSKAIGTPADDEAADEALSGLAGGWWW